MVAASQEHVSVRVRFQHHSSDSNSIERCSLREGEVILPTFLNGLLNNEPQRQQVAIAVSPLGIRRKLQWPGTGKLEDIYRTVIEVNVIWKNIW
jgi:hypothetical protein